MEECLHAREGERNPERVGYRSGYYERCLVTRVGTLELRVPQDREGRFGTEVFERYARSEKSLMSALTEMYVQGVSTRRVKAITEELCGHGFSACSVSRIAKRLDTELEQLARRRLEEARRDLAGMAWQVAGQIPEAVRLGGRQHRTDLLLLPFAVPTSQAREVHKYAGAVQPGDQAADPHRAHFPEWRELPAAGPGAGGEDP